MIELFVWMLVTRENSSSILFILMLETENSYIRNGKILEEMEALFECSYCPSALPFSYTTF